MTGEIDRTGCCGLRIAIFDMDPVMNKNASPDLLAEQNQKNDGERFYYEPV
jgi:hypothetical protein